MNVSWLYRFVDCGLWLAVDELLTTNYLPGFKHQNLSDPDPLAEFDIGRRLDRPFNLRRNGQASVLY
jgi:hypothetical protein